jgi:hypothetical protein
MANAKKVAKEVLAMPGVDPEYAGFAKGILGGG